jgi:hypothetical protein
MKIRFFIFWLILVLLSSFAVFAELSFDVETGKAFAKSSIGSGIITAPMKQEKKKPIYAYITKTGKKYHNGNCRHLKKSKIKITLEEAKKRGYTPCKVCKPPN